MEVIDMERAVDTYDEYRVLIEELEDARSDLKQIEESCGELKYYLSVLDALEYANKKNYGRYEDTINKFLSDHSELEEYRDLKYYIGTYLKDMSFLESVSICLPNSQFILLNKEKKKYLVDLRNLNMQDVTEYNPKLVEFIIKMLKTKDFFIGDAEISDLPLLMNIKEDLEKDNISDNDDECYGWEFESISYQILSEFRNAKIEDEKNPMIMNNIIMKSCPFVLDSNDVQAMWKELDELEPNISREEYLLRYYKLLMIFGNDVEKVYNEAPEEDKKYVLDAYQFYSSDVLKESEDMHEKIHHFRTVSPLINVEILKRKVLNKK